MFYDKSYNVVSADRSEHAPTMAKALKIAESFSGGVCIFRYNRKSFNSTLVWENDEQKKYRLSRLTSR